MRAMGFGRPIVWTFLPTQLVRDLIREIDSELTIYYCIDDFASSSPGARRILQSEDALLREADLVFVTSEALRERASRMTLRVHMFPFGVDYPAFARIREALDSIPDDVRDLPKPVIGYVGGIHRWVDQALLAAAAARLPNATFALVGPRQTDVSLLEGYPNIRLLGNRAHDQLPRYIKAFDVALIPYQQSAYTASVYPTKINEYLAMGVPVVSTDLPEIRRFTAGHGNVVRIATDAEDFALAIDEALLKNAPDAAAQRIAVASENSWDARIGRMSELIEAALTVRVRADSPWQERLRTAYRAARGRLAIPLAALVVGFALLLYTPLLWIIAEPLRIAQAPRSADGVVVFAGGVGESGTAGGRYQERVKHAVDLYGAGAARQLLFSSGFVFAFREAEVMRDLAVDNGVDPSAIALEIRAKNTYENVVFTRNIARGRGWRRVLLVSSPYHMRRAVLTWRKMAPDIEVVATPVPSSQFYVHGTGASVEQIRGIVQEYAAIAAYWWRGWI